MADRTLVVYDEDSDERAFWSRLRIERSAAGIPGGLITVETHEGPEGGPVQQCTIIVDDLRRLYPATDWASDISEHQRQIKQLGKPKIGSSIFREVDEAILAKRSLEEAAAEGRPVQIGGVGYVPAAEVIYLRALLTRVHAMGRTSEMVHGERLAAYIQGGLDAQP